MGKKMSNWIKTKTLPLRHWIIRRIGPNLYQDFKTYDRERAKISRLPRPMTMFVKTRLRLHRPAGHNKLTGVEIGTYKGENAENILQQLPIKQLYLIDPYTPYTEDGRTWDYGEAYKEAEQRLKPFRDQTTFIFALSSEAIKFIPDNLDFVYIDANHQYEYVKQDIINYYPKVRKGGTLGGHDYWFGIPGVPKAVDELTEKNSWKLYTKPYDWWIIRR